MKTIKFDCRGYSAPAYSCNKPGDTSGEYVPAHVAQGLYDALSSCSEWDGLPPHLQNKIDDALAIADGEDV